MVEAIADVYVFFGCGCGCGGGGIGRGYLVDGRDPAR